MTLNARANPAEADNSGTEQNRKEIVTTVAGQVAELLGQDANSLKEVSISGPVNDADFLTLWNTSQKGVLRLIDLSKAEVVSGKIPAKAFSNPTDASEGAPATIPNISLEAIYLPDDAVEIGDYAFYRSIRLKEFRLPSKIKRIGAYAFAECGNLSVTSLTLPDGLEEIGDHAFAKTPVPEVTIPASCATKGSHQFAGNLKLTKINLPEGWTCSADSFLEGCTALTHVGIPRDWTSIPVGFLKGCTSLRSVDLPEGVLEFGDYAFNGCAALENLTFPKGFRKIGDYALRNCEKIEADQLPGSLEEIGDSGISGCKFPYGFPDEFVLPASLKMLGRDNLRDVVVFEMVLPDNLESIGAGAFQRGAHAENLYCRATVPPVCEEGPENPPFGWAITKTSLLIVPEGSLSLYQEAYGWKEFSVISERPLADMPTSGIESIGSTDAGSTQRLYDLNGRRINNPLPGNIYIRIEDGKATKVVEPLR